MRRSTYLLPLVALLMLAVPGLALAEKKPNYSYVEAGYNKIDLDDLGGPPKEVNPKRRIGKNTAATLRSSPAFVSSSSVIQRRLREQGKQSGLNIVVEPNRGWRRRPRLAGKDVTAFAIAFRQRPSGSHGYVATAQP